MNPVNGKVLVEFGKRDLLIQVLENETQRWITINGQFTHSIMLKQQPEQVVLSSTQYLLGSLLFQQAPSKALVLGLGGGDLLRFYQHHFPQCRLDVVEKHAAVIRLARQYFGVGETAMTRLYYRDALTFMRESKLNYDVIYIDIADGDDMLPELFQHQFYQDCLAALTETGVIALNLITSDLTMVDNLLVKLHYIFQRQMLCYTVPQHANLIVLAFVSTPACLTKTGLIALAEQLAKQYQLPMTAIVNQIFAQNQRRGLFTSALDFG